MTLIKFKSDSPLRNRERNPYFSDLFNDLFENVPVSGFRKSTVPNVNIIENDEMYKLELAAPGLAKEDFKISIDNDILSVSTEKKSETSESTDKYTRKEFSYSSFQRSFTLPELVDIEKIGASYENGIMSISLPKKEEAKPKAPREIKIA
ncbi:MAG TPA: Hsp20/alpha crystallin family protein [Bacteroidia bacterium]|nr:Hsp20/alpha crystallin family protein [Bacteroidia bacterium]